MADQFDKTKYIWEVCGTAEVSVWSNPSSNQGGQKFAG